ncbi:MAG: hypothetical protein ACYC6Z_01775 [Thermoleophilia bacterium]
MLIAGAAVAALALCFWLAIPTASISPSDSQTGIALGQPITIDSSALASIGKVAVYADGEPLALEYNTGTGNLARDLDLKAGQQIRIEAKISSIIGITREFTSSFTMVPPIEVEAMTVNGARYVPGNSIPPQASLVFTFSKPLTQAAVSVDGSDKVDLELDPEHPELATFPPTVSLKQGATHLLAISATASDTSVLDSKVIRASVVKPLSLYGKVADSGGPVTIELDSNTAFADTTAVKAALETTLPDAGISVEKEKIVITCPGLDRGGSYTIKLNRANGANGSFLEAPLTMTLSFKADANAVPSTGGQAYRGYVYTSGGSAGASDAGSGAAGSGPPPGWPSCCPWPPQ